jgi:predicted dehydrogenase
MTYNIEQAQELVQLKKKHLQQILQIGHQYLYTPLYFKVKDMIKKGYLGKVTQVDCRWDRDSTWRRPAPLSGTGKSSKLENVQRIFWWPSCRTAFSSNGFYQLGF